MPDPNPKRFVVAPLDGPYLPDDPAFATQPQAKEAGPASFPGETLGLWDVEDDSLLVAIRWQSNWYEVS